MNLVTALVIISLANCAGLLFLLAFSAAHEKNNIKLHDLLARSMNLCDMYREELCDLHKHKDCKHELSRSSLGATDRKHEPSALEAVQSVGDSAATDGICPAGGPGYDPARCSATGCGLV